MDTDNLNIEEINNMLEMINDKINDLLALKLKLEKNKEILTKPIIEKKKVVVIIKKKQTIFNKDVFEDNKKKMMKELNETLNKKLCYDIRKLITLELKETFKDKDEEKFKIKGYSYKYVYVKPIHERVLIDTINKKDFYYRGFMRGRHIQSPILQEYFKKKNLDIQNMGWDAVNKIINSSSNKKTTSHYIRIRERIDYNYDYITPPMSRYNAIYIKKYDKDTKKTTSKGLKANKYAGKDSKYLDYSNYLSVDDLKDFCKLNGMKITSKDKFLYGHYADWILKVLV